jgi:hypothetical protein
MISKGADLCNLAPRRSVQRGGRLCRVADHMGHALRRTRAQRQPRLHFLCRAAERTTGMVAGERGQRREGGLRSPAFDGHDMPANAGSQAARFSTASDPRGYQKADEAREPRTVHPRSQPLEHFRVVTFIILAAPEPTARSKWPPGSLWPRARRDPSNARQETATPRARQTAYRSR